MGTLLTTRSRLLSLLLAAIDPWESFRALPALGSPAPGAPLHWWNASTAAG
jgi:hypothetical protein